MVTLNHCFLAPVSGRVAEVRGFTRAGSFPPHGPPGATNNPGRAPERAARRLSEVPGPGFRAPFPPPCPSAPDPGARPRGSARAKQGLRPGRGGAESRRARSPRPPTPGAGQSRGPPGQRRPRPTLHPWQPAPLSARRRLAGGRDPQRPAPPQRRTHPFRGAGARRPAARPPAVRP